MTPIQICTTHGSIASLMDCNRVGQTNGCLIAFITLLAIPLNIGSTYISF